MQNIIKFDIVNSPNEKENGSRYFRQKVGSISTTDIMLAEILTSQKEIDSVLEWIEKVNSKNILQLVNVEIIDLKSLKVA